MLGEHKQIEFTDKEWRKINMRKVSHLLGAEMLHNLYGRYWPRINSIRFRHTITNFKAGTVESFAPIVEWQFMQNWLSKRFLQDDPVLIREIRSILNPSYDLINETIEKIDNTNLSAIDNDQLGLLLIDILDYPLGDIYKLNVVQIEYSLNYAIHSILAEYEPNELDRNQLLSKLIATQELTVAQTEEVAFGEILKLCAESSWQINSQVTELLVQHHNKYAATHCAYGENPPTLEDYFNKLRYLLETKATPLTETGAKKNALSLVETSDRLLSKINNPLLTKLCKLMADIGVFRDVNKAKLGETVVRRLQIIDEIARRTNTQRSSLDYYLMSEMLALLSDDTVLSHETITKRREEGVRFERNEDMTLSTRNMSVSKSNPGRTQTITGICASPGRLEGTARVISSKDDIEKLAAGEIMVAIGTDFDLIEIMNKAGGIITEEGGLLSHASVVSRELKKPCLIGVSQATKRIQDGDEIILDATTGTITFSSK